MTTEAALAPPPPPQPLPPPGPPPPARPDLIPGPRVPVPRLRAVREPARVLRPHRQPPPPADRLQAGHPRRDDLRSRLARHLPQAPAPLPVRRPEPPAVHPVGVHALLDQVPLPAVIRHRRGDRRRGRSPAAGVRGPEVFLGGGAPPHQGAVVALPPAPVPRHHAPLDPHPPRRGPPGRGP